MLGKHDITHTLDKTKGMISNAYAQTKHALHRAYVTSKPIILSIDKGITQYAKIHQHIINPVINAYEGNNADHVKQLNRRINNAVADYDRLRTTVVGGHTMLKNANLI